MAYLLLVLLAAVAFVLAGLTGLLFHVWPTDMGNEPIRLSPSVVSELRLLRDEKKFVEHPASSYPGAMNEGDRMQAQRHVDALLSRLIDGLPSRPTRAFLLAEFKRALRDFDTPESEERDRLLLYLEQIMGMVGVTSSGRLLAVWRYGFPIGWGCLR